MIKTLAFHLDPKKKSFSILDQSLLPEKKKFINIQHPKDMLIAIKEMKVRGANFIGIAAAISLAKHSSESSEADLKKWARKLERSRPTAIHLSLSIKKVMSKKDKWREALRLLKEDQENCLKMASKGASLIKKKSSLITYCNTGSLATAGIGTALGVIRKAFKEKKLSHVYVCETRPLLQGSRLTFFELKEEGIPCTLICDNMAASLFKDKKIDLAFVGADRISEKGDTANKIGTLNLAILCHHFQIPFYVVAPEMSVDKKIKKGESIKIEERKKEEISSYFAKKRASIYNPAFDVTPKNLISGIVTEKRIWRP